MGELMHDEGNLIDEDDDVLDSQDDDDQYDHDA